MAIHNQSDATLTYIAESALGTTPSNPDTTAIEFLPGSTFQPDLVKQLSEGLRGDALARNQYLVGKSWTGNLQMELRPSQVIYDLVTAGCKSGGFAGSTPVGDTDVCSNTASSGTTFTVTLDATSDNTDWVSVYKAAVGAQVYLNGAGFNGNGTWRITAISTSSATNDTITVTGTGADSISLTAATSMTSIIINHAEYGTTDASFTFEQAWDSDYMAWLGGRVKTLDLTIPMQGVSTVAFGLVGQNFSSSGITLGTGSRGSTYATSTAYHNNNLDMTVEEGGSSFGGYVASLTLNIDNGYRLLNAASSGLTAAEIMSGKFAVSGSVDVYFENLTQYNKALNHTQSSLLVSIDNESSGGTPMYIYLPKLYYQVPELPPAGIEEDPILTIPFVALADTSGDILNIDWPNTLS